jgi:phage N-6-adenine-methyltransferase
MFSSASGEWETPQELFNAVDAVFHFTLDACATHENAKCARYFTKLEDGLKQEWKGVCWMNHPLWTGDNVVGREGLRVESP